jgi:hypothetical protein
MKIKAIYILAFILATITLNSCKKNMLDIVPTNLYPTETLILNKQNIEITINGIYAQTAMSFGRIDNGWVPAPFQLFYEGISDDALSNPTDVFFNTSAVTKGALSPSNLACFQNKWANSFRTIKFCNQFLTDIESSPVSEADKALYKDEVRFLRSYLYFDLVKLFGGVPLVLTVHDISNIECIPRSTSDDCFKFIITEVNEIIKNGNLPKSYNSLEAKQKGKVTLAAVHALNTEASLFYASKLFNPANDKNRWSDAAAAAKNAIDFCLEQGIDMEDNYEKVFVNQSQPYSKEVIWDVNTNVKDVYFYTVFDFHDRFLNPNSAGGYSGYQPTQSLVEAYETKDGKDIKDPTSGYTLDKFWENRDPRFYATILYDSASWKGKLVKAHYTYKDLSETSYSLALDMGPTNANGTLTGYVYRKLCDSTFIDLNGGIGFGAAHFIVYRFTELLLDYAETQLELGNEDVARIYINKVRSRPSVNLPAVTDAGDALWKRYRNERRVEFTLEGHRYNDLRRWKLAEEVLSEFEIKGVSIWERKKKNGITQPRKFEISKTIAKYTFAPKNYLLPIPQAEIDICGSVIPQNPGY